MQPTNSTFGIFAALAASVANELRPMRRSIHPAGIGIPYPCVRSNQRKKRKQWRRIGKFPTR